MYNQPYFIPNYYTNMAAPNMMRGAMNGALMGARGAGHGMGLFGRIGSSIASLRSLNWGGFINNASKTLGVINQTIPLVRQVGPMFHNMKSMLRVASIFKDETDRKPNRKNNIQENHSYSTKSNNSSNNYNESFQHSFQENTNQRSPFNPSHSYYQNSSLSNQESNLNESSDDSPTFFIQ